MIPTIQFETGGLFVRDAAMLPVIPKSFKYLYADFETSSGDPHKMSVNPWRNCTTIGVAVAFDDGPVSFIGRELLMTGWWADVMKHAHECGATWVNHNIKYDAHVSANDLGTVAATDLMCTLTGAKLVDSDRIMKGGYGLEVLSKCWCNRDIDGFYFALRPYLHNNKDYAAVPIDILAEYGCMDIFAVRDLHQYLERNIPAESSDVWRTEQQITNLLYKIERTGVYIDPLNLKTETLQVLIEMLRVEEELERLVGRSFRPHVPDDLYDVLCNQYGLPVLQYTDGGSPSFDKNALAMYAEHPAAPEAVIKRIIRYKKLGTYKSLFLDAYEDLHVNGVMHPSYNQSVRTGRMSCSDPNMQQLDKRAKALIIPPPGYGIISADFSQVELRIIVHYIENERAIRAYNDDPWTDFHQFTADSVPTTRRAAKTLNFAMGYGAGRNKTVFMLSINKDVVQDVIAQCGPDASPQEVNEACQIRAVGVFNKYHQMFPELRPTSRQAGNRCRARGYVRNHYGRRRHLPETRSHTAFNSACQSTAGDMIKERMVALDQEIPEFIQAGQVHDNVFGYAPLELLEDPKSDLLTRIAHCMNDVKRPLRVPLRTAIGWSPNNLAHASSEERELHP